MAPDLVPWSAHLSDAQKVFAKCLLGFLGILLAFGWHSGGIRRYSGAFFGYSGFGATRKPYFSWVFGHLNFRPIIPFIKLKRETRCRECDSAYGKHGMEGARGKSLKFYDASVSI